jgi:hypothetical protein
MRGYGVRCGAEERAAGDLDEVSGDPAGVV